MRKYRFLYVNICEKDAYRGHKLFDMEYASILSTIGEVDVIEPEEGWYEANKNINIILYDPAQDINKFTTHILKKLEKGFIQRISPYIHLCNYNILKQVEKLDRKYNYTTIIAAHLDLFAYIVFRKKSSLNNKLFVIEHMPSAYLHKFMRKAFNITKNKMTHLVMERVAIEFYENEYGVQKDKLQYLPHPFNEIKINKGKKQYNIVGISNSNSPAFIRNLIEMEKQISFFKNNEIKAIFRTGSETFDNGWLKVIKGCLGLSFEEYYSYILNADLIVAPFETDFGARTSGTIIDGLSNGIPVIGSSFITMMQYSNEYPNACKVFGDLKEMCDMIVDYLKNAEAYKVNAQQDFDNFRLERSVENIADNFMKLFSHQK